MIINKFKQESVNVLMNSLKSDFDNQKLKYTDHITGGFDLSKDSLECVDGNISIYGTIELNADESDFDNAKKIFQSLDVLSPEDADDERLWTYLCHITFFEYGQKRWLNPDVSMNKIEDRFFYKGSGRVARTRNALSRLWWIPYLTFNKEGADETEKWKYTAAAFSSQEVLVSLFERSMGSYQNIRKAFLDFVIDYDPSGKEVQYLSKKINNLGGVYMLPCLSEEKIKNILETEHRKYTDQ
jgi:hypothetical protein